jgi:O-antigen ligase
MSNIYNFLNNVWQEILRENKQNKAFIPFVFLLIIVPISMGLNNISLGLFVASSLYYFNKTKNKISFVLLIPILLFLWMSLSYFWSIDVQKTLHAIPKELGFLLIPVAFWLIPPFSNIQKTKIIKYYSFAMTLYVLFFLVRAIIRFIATNDTSVFFYHGPENDIDTGLVPRLLNAIHFSVYVAIAFFYFFSKEHKTKLEQMLSVFLFVFVILLSSKNIILVFIFLIGIHFFYFSKSSNKMRLRNLAIFIFIVGSILSFSKIKNRFLVEFQSNTKTSVSHSVFNEADEGVNYVSIYEAWNNDKFTHGDYFPGTAFRVYQFRLFTEFLKEEPIFWNGFGLNASLNKLLEKEKKYNLYPGYGTFNFHNQYIQNFAELGIVGFILLVIMLFLNLKKALKNKDFLHISFAILMISLFLTESFLWRQRGVVFFTAFYCLFNTSHFLNNKQ